MQEVQDYNRLQPLNSYNHLKGGGVGEWDGGEYGEVGVVGVISGGEWYISTLPYMCKCRPALKNHIAIMAAQSIQHVKEHPAETVV